MYQVFVKTTGHPLPGVVCPTEGDAQCSAEAHYKENLSKTARGSALLRDNPNYQVPISTINGAYEFKYAEGVWIQVESVVHFPDDTLDLVLFKHKKSGRIMMGPWDCDMEIFMDDNDGSQWKPKQIESFFIVPAEKEKEDS